jgi:hypothetical protein
MAVAKLTTRGRSLEYYKAEYNAGARLFPYWRLNYLGINHGNKFIKPRFESLYFSTLGDYVNELDKEYQKYKERYNFQIKHGLNHPSFSGSGRTKFLERLLNSYMTTNNSVPGPLESGRAWSFNNTSEASKRQASPPKRQAPPPPSNLARAGHGPRGPRVPRQTRRSNNEATSRLKRSESVGSSGSPPNNSGSRARQAVSNYRPAPTVARQTNTQAAIVTQLTEENKPWLDNIRAAGFRRLQERAHQLTLAQNAAVAAEAQAVEAAAAAKKAAAKKNADNKEAAKKAKANAKKAEAAAKKAEATRKKLEAEAKAAAELWSVWRKTTNNLKNMNINKLKTEINKGSNNRQEQLQQLRNSASRLKSWYNLLTLRQINGYLNRTKSLKEQAQRYANFLKSAKHEANIANATLLTPPSNYKNVIYASKRFKEIHRELTGRNENEYKQFKALKKKIKGWENAAEAKRKKNEEEAEAKRKKNEEEAEAKRKKNEQEAEAKRKKNEEEAERNRASRERWAKYEKQRNAATKIKAAFKGMKARKNVKRMRENNLMKLTNTQLYTKIVGPANSKLWLLKSSLQSFTGRQRYLTPSQDRALRSAEREKEKAFAKYQNIIIRRPQSSTPIPSSNMTNNRLKKYVSADTLVRLLAGSAKEAANAKAQENAAKKAAANTRKKEIAEGKRKVAPELVKKPNNSNNRGGPSGLTISQLREIGRAHNAKAAKRQTTPAARGAALMLSDPELYKQILAKQKVLKRAPTQRKGGFATLGGSTSGGAAGGRVAVKK